jgi:FixJ family two-component response regulator
MDTKGLVIVATDDRPSRARLAGLVRRDGYEVGTCSDGWQALDRVGAPGEPCCVVCEVRLPGLDGLALQQELRARGMPARVVFVTRCADLATAVSAFKGGAVDVLLHPADRSALLAAVATAIASARGEAARRLEDEALRARYATLTRREREVFALVAAGLLNKQVAFELGNAVKTVKTQRGAVVQKMGAGSLADLVRMADRLASAPTLVGNGALDLYA